LNARNIPYICFHFSLDSVDHPDDLGKSIPYAEFYRAMENGAETKTSQVSVGEYVSFFTKYLEQGKDILHICFSSGLSGTYSSALIAQEMLKEQFPHRKLYLVDSLCASSGYGLMMDTLADMRDGGMDIDTLHEWSEAHKLEMHHFFFTTDLTYLYKGGRVSKGAVIVCDALSICPLMFMNRGGKLAPYKNVRTKRRVIAEIVHQMELHAQGGLNYNGKCFISQSACMEDAKAVAQLVEQKFTKLNGKVLINDIGTTVGSHTGPGTVALFFWGDERSE